MSLLTYNDFINRITGQFTLSEPFYGSVGTTTSVGLGANSNTYQINAYHKALPTLPAGVTAYIPTSITLSASVGYTYMICKVINLGSLDISTPTFTDGAAMPTVTELGVSRQVAGPIFMEVTTALSATPGSITVTYTDQDGNTAETTTAQTLTASSTLQTSGVINLNSPDWGVTDITSATRTGGTTPTGVIKFWGAIPLAIMATPGNQLEFKNLLTYHFNPLRLGAGDVIRVIGFSGNTAKAVAGDIFYVGDN